jgi:AraC-like DNA-binding protein
MKQPANATYGYRFTDAYDTSFYRLFAVGFERIGNSAYDWDGLKRIDGPLYLFQYTVSGCGHLDIGGRTHRIGPGQAFMVDIPGKHRYYWLPGSGEWEFYFVLFRPDGLETLWKDAVSRLGTVADFPPQSGVVRALKEMFLEASANRITDSYAASSLVYRFMMELLRFSDIGRRELKTWPEPVRQAAELMDTAAACGLTVGDIARETGVSKFHFTRMFTKATGQTPVNYMTRIRMERAVELLRGTELSVEDIARQIGYSSGSYFSKVFRERVGFSPSEFREARGLTPVKQMKFD